jgi:hypothetical protein
MYLKTAIMPVAKTGLKAKCSVLTLMDGISRLTLVVAVRRV